MIDWLCQLAEIMKDFTTPFPSAPARKDLAQGTSLGLWFRD